jgi:hypothetical protein
LPVHLDQPRGCANLEVKWVDPTFALNSDVGRDRNPKVTGVVWSSRSPQAIPEAGGRVRAESFLQHRIPPQLVAETAESWSRLSDVTTAPRFLSHPLCRTGWVRLCELIAGRVRRPLNWRCWVQNQPLSYGRPAGRRRGRPGPARAGPPSIPRKACRWLEGFNSMTEHYWIEFAPGYIRLRHDLGLQGR